MSMPTKPTSSDGINTIIKKNPAKKSPGHNLITNYLVKILPRKAIVYLSHFYNVILRIILKLGTQLVLYLFIRDEIRKQCTNL
jgi:hypothetical protein